ncbi:MAG TPA: hypothetical protein DCL77_09060, partial [Prolixibacteraceae bacterium]|nr:hypothetical protein [Prolixibacteraceae bacterium]
MATGRAVSSKIVVLTNAIGGKLVDLTSRVDQSIVVFDQAQDKYIHVQEIQTVSGAAYRHVQLSPSRVWLGAH